MRRAGLAFELTIYGLAALSFLAGAANDALRPEPFEPGKRRDGVLRVATWNVGEGLRADGAGLSDENLAHVASVLNELDPDLCFLQELNGRWQGRQLLEALGRGWVMELSPSGSTRRVAALCRRGTLEPFEVEDAGRRALGVVYRWQGVPYVAIGMHADAFSARDRNEEIGSATETLFANEASNARMLLGDLNLDLDLDKRRDLFTDDEYLDVETYNFVADRLVDVGLGLGATAEPDRRLDYVFVSPEAFEVRAAGPWLDQRGAGMDHDPLVADLVPTE